MNLFNLTQEQFALLDLIEQNEGEMSPEQEEALLISKQDFERKAFGYRGMIKHVESELAACEDERDHLNRLIRIKKNQVDRLENALSDSMKVLGLDELKFPTGRISFRRSESVEIENEALIPKKYIRVTEKREPNKVEIKKALKEGLKVRGAFLQENKNIQIT